MPAHTTTTAIGSCTIWREADKITRFMLLTEDTESVAPPDWLRPIIERVQQHLRGSPEDFSDTPLDWDLAAPFQRRVYEAALKTKSGQTATYGHLAKAIGEVPAVSRAVGTALGQNPWPLLVPLSSFRGRQRQNDRLLRPRRHGHEAQVTRNRRQPDVLSLKPRAPVDARGLLPHGRSNNFQVSRIKSQRLLRSILLILVLFLFLSVSQKSGGVDISSAGSISG